MSSKQQINNRIFSYASLLIIVGIVVVINIIAAFVYFRIDTTDDERYSLAPGSIEFLKNLNNGKINEGNTKKANRIYMKIYLEGELPAEIKRFRNAIETKLQEFKNIAGDRIEYEFIDPKVKDETEQKAIYEKLYNNGEGIMPLEINYEDKGGFSNLLLWPGAEITYGADRKIYSQFLPGSPQGRPQQLNQSFSQGTIQNAVNNLEYMLITAIRKTVTTSKPRVAFIQGHGELNFGETQRVRSIVDDYYSIEDVTLNDSLGALKNFRGAIIADPKTPFSDKDLFIIDQFVMNGGKLMVMMDMLDFPKDSLYMKGAINAMGTNLRLDQMMFHYGLKLTPNYVMDARCSFTIVPTAKQQLLPWFFYVLSTPTKHPISRNIEPVMLRYASEVTLNTAKGRVVTPVLTSSTNSNRTPSPPIISLAIPMNYIGKNNVVRLNNNPESELNKVCLAGLSEGFYESFFKNRVVDAYAKNPETGYLAQSKKESKILLIGNGEILKNAYDTMRNEQGVLMYRPKEFNNLRFDEIAAQYRQKIILGNQEFFQNSMDYLLGDNSVLDIRSKQIDMHPMDQTKVQESGAFYQIINLLLPSSIVVFIALILLSLRKRRYTSK